MKIQFQTHRDAVFGDYPLTAPPVLDDDVFTDETFEENGLIMVRKKPTKLDPKQRYKGMKATDFALQNLIAIGAVDSLKFVQMATPAAALEDVVSHLDDFGTKIIDSVKVPESTVENTEVSE